MLRCRRCRLHFPCLGEHNQSWSIRHLGVEGLSDQESPSCTDREICAHGLHETPLLGVEELSTGLTVNRHRSPDLSRSRAEPGDNFLICAESNEAVPARTPAGIAP